MLRSVGGVRPYLSSIMALLLIGGGLFSLAPSILAQEPNQAGLVILHGDGSATTRCVEFSEPEISGFDLLQRSQLPLSLDNTGMGAAVCSIADEGCITPQEDCFCAMSRTPAVYWSYWQVVNGEWRYASLGAANTLVQPGSVEGWIWGTGRIDEAAPPPAYTIDQICTAATATPTLTLTPEPTATETASPAERPTDTPSPTMTATFTPLPTSTATPQPVTETPTPTPTATPSPTHSPMATWTARPTVTPTLLPQSVAMAAQPTVTQSHLLRLPALQAPATAAAVALIEPTVEPPMTPTMFPTDALPTTAPQIVEVVATEPPPIALPAMSQQEVTPEVVVIVVTSPAVAPTLPTPMPTVLPTLDPQLAALTGMMVGAGMALLLPMGLVFVAAIAYWVARKL